MRKISEVKAKLKSINKEHGEVLDRVMRKEKIKGDILRLSVLTEQIKLLSWVLNN